MKKYFYLMIFIVLSFQVNAQSGEIIMTIDNKPITTTEFTRLFDKSNSQEGVKKNTVKEYLQFFINYKLKVIDGERLKIDTATAFRNELDGYRRLSARPYFTDNTILDRLVKQAYERLHTEIRVSHILVSIDINASEKDSILAYNKAMKIRKRIAMGENFAQVAKETSDFPSAINDGGDLWYKSALSTPYNFENYIYQAPLNEISMPVRTPLGYHIIKVTDKRKALWKIKIAHIMIYVQQKADSSETKKAKDKIDEIYRRLKNGENFVKLANEMSDDKGTLQNGGELDWFGTGKMDTEFETAAYNLKKTGDISIPVKTKLGWHIIKLIDKKDVEPFSSLENDIRNYILNSDRSEMAKQTIIEKLKNEYQFKNLSNLSDFYNVVDSTLLEGKWDVQKASALNQPLFSFADKTYNQQDFANYIFKHQNNSKKIPFTSLVNILFNQYVDEEITNYEITQLEKKYPEFYYTMKEYHDGMIIFELTDKMVWSKAMKDSIGLSNFYNMNKNKYLGDEVYDVSIFSLLKTDDIADIQKIFDKRAKKNYTDEDIVKQINKEYSGAISFLKKGSFSVNANDTMKIIHETIKNDKNGVNYVLLNDKKLIIYINNKIPAQPIPLKEIKGIVIEDYQKYLEDNWLASLREKYKVVVDEKVVNSIKR